MKLPPLLQQFANYWEKNPALGSVVALVAVAVLLLILRKSIKFFVVLILLGVVAILASYFFYGPDKTNKAIREGTQQAAERGKDLLERARENGEEEAPMEEGQPAGG